MWAGDCSTGKQVYTQPRSGSVPAGGGSFWGALWWKLSCGKQSTDKLKIDKSGGFCACFSLPRPSVRERNSPVLRNCSMFREPLYLIGEIPSWNLKGIGIGREGCPLKRSGEQRASVTWSTQLSSFTLCKDLHYGILCDRAPVLSFSELFPHSSCSSPAHS